MSGRNCFVNDLTDRQSQVLVFIEGYIASRGYAPSLMEIGSAIGTAYTNGVRCHLTALHKKGFIERTGVVSRGIRVLKSGVSK